MADPPAAPRPGRPLPIFTPSRGFYPSEQIESHLSEKTIQCVFDNPGKPGAETHGCAGGLAEVLLHDVTLL